MRAIFAQTVLVVLACFLVRRRRASFSILAMVASGFAVALAGVIMFTHPARGAVTWHLASMMSCTDRLKECSHGCDAATEQKMKDLTNDDFQKLGYSCASFVAESGTSGQISPAMDVQTNKCRTSSTSTCDAKPTHWAIQRFCPCLTGDMPAEPTAMPSAAPTAAPSESPSEPGAGDANDARSASLAGFSVFVMAALQIVSAEP